MSGNPDRDRATSRGDQLIECTVKKAALEASLHAAQMLLLDIVDVLSDDTYDSTDRQLAIEHAHRKIRQYLMTSAWVLPPDRNLLTSLSLVSAEEVPASQGEGETGTSNGEAY